MRIQRKRVKGWKMPENTISVTRPGKWGNPFKIGDTVPLDKIPTGIEFDISNQIFVRNASDAITLYRTWLKDQIQMKKLDISELRGKNLACFCPPDQPCHVDVLLDMLNNGANI